MNPHFAVFLCLAACERPSPAADERVWLSASFDGDLGGADPQDVYRLHPDPRAAAAAWAALPPPPCEQARPCADPLTAMNPAQPRPRLFYAEACASLTLVLLDQVDLKVPPPPGSKIPFPTCATRDGYVVFPDQLVHHLLQRAETASEAPLTGATLAPNGFGPRHRVDGTTETWDPAAQAWRGCCGANGQEHLVPGLPPGPLDLEIRPSRMRWWEREGLGG